MEKIFSDELEKLINSRNHFMEIFQSFQEDYVRITNSFLPHKNLIDSEESCDLPESQLRLYAFLDRHDYILFDTEAELTEYVQSNQDHFQNICAIDYLGDFAGRNNVIKITYLDGRYIICTAIKGEVGFNLYHDVLNIQKSKISGEPVWEVDDWGLKSIYEAFREKDIIPYINDPYVEMIRLNRTLNGLSSKRFN